MRISDWSSDVCSSDLTILGQIFEVRTIGEVDRPALVIIEKARDPFDRPVVARHQPRFLNEQIVITIGVESKGKGLSKGARKVEVEGGVIVRQRRRADRKRVGRGKRVD